MSESEGVDLQERESKSASKIVAKIAAYAHKLLLKNGLVERRPDEANLAEFAAGISALIVDLYDDEQGDSSYHPGDSEKSGSSEEEEQVMEESDE